MKTWTYILIGSLAFALYANTLNHDYVLDDKAIITQNTFTQKGFSGIFDHLTHSYWYGINNKDAGNYRPMSGISFSIENALFGNNPTMGHLLNILFYALLCMVLYHWLRTLQLMDQRWLMLSIILFAAHPIHTEVVANIKSRDEIYALLFFALSAIQFGKWLRFNKVSHIVLCNVLLFASLLSKETTIALIPLFTLISLMQQPSWRQALIHSIYPIVVSIFYLVLYVSVTDILSGDAYHIFDNALVQDAEATKILATKFWILGEYLSLLCIPYPLVYDYSFNTIPLVGFSNIQSLISIIGVLGLIAFYTRFILQVKKSKYLVYCFLLSLVILPVLPVSNLFFPIGSTMAERFLFIPSLGFCLGLVLILQWILNQIKLRHAYILSSVVIVITMLYSFTTFERNKAWKSDETLFKNDLGHLPQNAKAHHNLANIYKAKAEKATNATQKRTYYESAVLLLEQALTIYEVQEFHHELGLIYGELGKWDGVIKALGNYVKMNPSDAMAWMQIGLANGMSGNIQDAEFAFKTAYQLEPKNAEICLNLSKTYAIKGELEKAREIIIECEAIDASNEAIRQLKLELLQTP